MNKPTLSQKLKLWFKRQTLGSWFSHGLNVVLVVMVIVVPTLFVRKYFFASYSNVFEATYLDMNEVDNEFEKFNQSSLDNSIYLQETDFLRVRNSFKTAFEFTFEVRNTMALWIEEDVYYKNELLTKESTFEKVKNLIKNLEDAKNWIAKSLKYIDGLLSPLSSKNINFNFYNRSKQNIERARDRIINSHQRLTDFLKTYKKLA